MDPRVQAWADEQIVPFCEQGTPGDKGEKVVSFRNTELWNIQVGTSSKELDIQVQSSGEKSG